jgi:hypothetical protein
MQRGHPEVARQFSLHFDGIKTKVGNLEFEVSEASIATTTEIPNTGERWFKSMILNASFPRTSSNQTIRKTICLRECLGAT